MRKILFVLACMLSLLSGGEVHADLLLPDTHIITACSKITNTAEFSDTVFIGAVYDSYNYDDALALNKNYVISSDVCLDTGGKQGRFFYGLTVFAFEKKYYERLVAAGTLELTIKSMIKGGKGDGLVVRADWPSDFTADSRSFDRLQQSDLVEVKIAGFSGHNLLFYKFRQVIEYSDKPAQTINFDKPKFNNIKTSWDSFSIKTNPATSTEIIEPDKAATTTVNNPDDRFEPRQDEKETVTSDLDKSAVQPTPPAEKQLGWWQSIKCFFFKLFGMACE